MLTFEPFRLWIVKAKKSRMDIVRECKFSRATSAKIWNDGLPVRSDTIEALCRTYGLRIEEVVEYREDEDMDS
jgi:DNA-binding Xre family transcriptional regulator